MAAFPAAGDREADARLSAQTQPMLEKEFARVEEKMVGAGKHEECHRLLEEPEKAYRRVPA